MKHIIRRSAVLSLLVTVIFLVGTATSAKAQHGYRVTKRVSFKSGQVGTTVSGKIPNTLESHEYIVRARRGQTIMVRINTARPRLGFYIMSPTNAMQEEEPFLKHYTGTLEETGDYHIFVYTEKGAGKYTMQIQIASDI